MLPMLTNALTEFGLLYFGLLTTSDVALALQELQGVLQSFTWAGAACGKYERDAMPPRLHLH